MPSENAVDLVRAAYEAYAGGDTAAILDLVDPDLEWTFLDPSEADPEPRVCHGSGELATWMARHARRGLHPQLEEVIGYGERVLVVTRMPGLDAFRVRQADDRNFHIVTVRGGRISELRACRSRAEAVAFANGPSIPPR